MEPAVPTIRSPIALHTARRRTRRCGVSLLEVVAVMGANAALVAVAIAALTAAVRADRLFARRGDDVAALSAAMAACRTDLRAASRCDWDEAARVLTVSLPSGETIEHRFVRDRAERWTRPAAGGDAVLSGALRLPPATRLSVEPPSAAAGELVRLNFQRPAPARQSDRQPPRLAELVVAVGKDARLLHD